MTVREITHIDKPDRDSPHDAIRRYAGPGWRSMNRLEAVAWANTPGNKFVVKNPMTGKNVDVQVRENIYGTKFLQTVADRTATNNLLSLPPIGTASALLGIA